MTQLYKDNTIGYYRASGLESIDFYQSLKNENAQITIEPIGDPTYNIKTLNNRYATVELTNAKVKIALKSPDFNFDVTEDLSGLFFLKLDSKSQKWKIYDFQAYSTDPDELPLFGL